MNYVDAVKILEAVYDCLNSSGQYSIYHLGRKCCVILFKRFVLIWIILKDGKLFMQEKLRVSKF